MRGLMRLTLLSEPCPEVENACPYVGGMALYRNACCVHTLLYIEIRKDSQINVNEKRFNWQLRVERAPKGIVAIVGVHRKSPMT